MLSVLPDYFFSQAVSPFSDNKLPFEFLGFLLIHGTSGCLCIPDTSSVLQSYQMHFLRTFLVHRPSFQTFSPHFGRQFLWQYFPGAISFCSVIFFFKQAIFIAAHTKTVVKNIYCHVGCWENIIINTLCSAI